MHTKNYYRQFRDKWLVCVAWYQIRDMDRETMGFYILRYVTKQVEETLVPIPILSLSLSRAVCMSHKTELISLHYHGYDLSCHFSLSLHNVPVVAVITCYLWRLYVWLLRSVYVGWRHLCQTPAALQQVRHFRKYRLITGLINSRFVFFHIFTQFF